MKLIALRGPKNGRTPPRAEQRFGLRLGRHRVDAADPRRLVPGKSRQDLVVRHLFDQARLGEVAAVVARLHRHRQNGGQRRLVIFSQPPVKTLPTAEHHQAGPLLHAGGHVRMAAVAQSRAPGSR